MKWYGQRINWFRQGLVLSLVSWFLFGAAEASFSGKLADLNRVEDWTPVNDASDLSQSGDGVQFQSTGADPYLHTRPIEFSTALYQCVIIEMSVDRGSSGQLFWSRKTEPGFREANSKTFTLKADGTFRTYVLVLADDPNWQGKITQLRLDPTDAAANITIRSFQIWARSGPVLEEAGLSPSSPFFYEDESPRLTVAVRNKGDTSATVELACQLGGRDHTQQNILIPPQESKNLTIELPPMAAGLHEFSCHWRLRNRNSKAQIASQGVQRTVLQVVERGIASQTLLQTPASRMFVYPGERSSRLAWQVKDATSIAMPLLHLPVLGKVIYQTRSGEIEEKVFDAGNLERLADERIEVQETWQDVDGVSWRVTCTIQTDEANPNAYRFHYSLRAPGGRLLHLSGPRLYAGDRSTGEAFDAALFPGLEYLEAGDVSSSSRVARGPVQDQYVPHPYKVTVPLQSLSLDGHLLSLLWPDQYQWGKQGRHIGSVFSAPNRWMKQRNHLMGVFVPSPAETGLENRERGQTPYPIADDETITLECSVHIQPGSEPVEALDAWLALYGDGRVPPPVEPPRNYEQAIALSRVAYTTTCWDAEQKGWGHCAGWQAHPSGGMLALLDVDAHLSADPQVEESLSPQIKAVYERILEVQGPFGLGRNTGCHIMVLEPVFHWGVAEQTLPHWKRKAADFANRQNEDGSWGFFPAREEQEDLAEEGEVVSGTISRSAAFIMEVARISADPVAVQSGLKAVDALNRYHVPRGSQGWEVPLQAPDIMTAAQGCRANLDAYWITGKQHYLEMAAAWARRGLPFLYLWNLPQAPLQRYASIPVFGATYYHHNWRGVPVQWCGLDYAYSLQLLGPHDDSYPWRTIAKGIINSALHQQITEGELKGTLPDSYADGFEVARGPFINPENIMTNLHSLHGNPLWIRTWFPHRHGMDALRVSANADIQPGSAKQDQTLSFDLSATATDAAEVLIAPVEQAPKAVTYQHAQNTPQSVPEHEALLGETLAWRYMPEFRALICHVPVSETRSTVEIAW